MTLTEGGTAEEVTLLTGGATADWQVEKQSLEEGRQTRWGFPQEVHRRTGRWRNSHWRRDGDVSSRRCIWSGDITNRRRRVNIRRYRRDDNRIDDISTGSRRRRRSSSVDNATSYLGNWRKGNTWLSVTASNAATGCHCRIDTDEKSSKESKLVHRTHAIRDLWGTFIRMMPLIGWICCLTPLPWIG